MKRTKVFALAAVLLGSWALADSARAFERPWWGVQARRYARMQPWHDGYSHGGWGTPVALVVPPTAENEVHWGWGVGATRITKVYPQFRLGYPGPIDYNAGAFQSTPRWPSNTDQLGVYPVRGPW